jgi:Mg-chelatase subunit ChlD
MKVNPMQMGAAQLVAAALGRVFGIEVVMSHLAQTAYTDRKKIVLPFLPVNLCEQVAKILWGFIHHEAGHCRHTDFSVRIDNAAELQADRLLDNLLGILEDIRMERAHMRFYPGATRTLAELVEVLVDISFFKPIPPDADVNHVFHDFVLKHLRSTVLGQSALRDQAAQSRDALERLLGAGFVTRLVAELQPIIAAGDTTDALNIAYRVRQFLKDELEAQQSPPPPSNSGDQSDSSQSSDDDAAASSSGNSGDNDEMDDAAQSASSDEEADQQDASDQKSASQAGDDSEQEDDGSSSSTSDSDDADSDAAQQALQDILASGQLDSQLGDLGEALCDILNQKVQQEPGRPVALPEDQRRSHGTRDRSAIAKARSVSSRLAVQLKRQLESHNIVLSDPSTRGKRVSRRHLYRVAHKDYRVFAHRQYEPEVNTAVVSLIDVSGSMASDRKVEIASDAILATALALGTIPFIEHAAGAFPSTQGSGKVELVQDFSESAELISSRFNLSSRGSTPLAEALLWAAHRLLPRAEERKIIFVATDGDPDDVQTTKEILDHLTRLRIEVHGLGIQSEDRHGLFDSFVKVDDVATLPQAFLTLFQRLLRRTA